MRTFDSLLFRPRTGLCRKTICLVDRLPSLEDKKREKERWKKRTTDEKSNWQFNRTVESIPFLDVMIKNKRRMKCYEIFTDLETK